MSQPPPQPEPITQNNHPKDVPLHFRKTTHQDIPAVIAIENEQFTNPWKEDFFTRELDHSIAFFYVAEALADPRQSKDNKTGSEIIGYILFWIIGPTVELHDIAVSGAYHQKGIGSRLMDFLIKKARTAEAVEVFLEVRKSNTPAIRLYEKYGFSQIGKRKDYYQNPLEDALIYKLALPEDDCHC